MISHLRLATTNPSYHPPGCLVGRSALNSSLLDRTGALQNSLQGSFFARTNKPPERLLTTGDMPAHFSGRGHLEGTCMAKGEGLLENKKQKRKRRGKKGERGGKKEMGNESDEDDCYDQNSSSDEEEEERKVWKPSSSSISSSSSTNPFSSSKVTPTVSLPQNQNKQQNQDQNGGAGAGLDGDIASLNREGLDWSKTTKYGRKSNKNFQEWLDVLGKKMHDQQTQAEDALFLTSF